MRRAIVAASALLLAAAPSAPMAATVPEQVVLCRDLQTREPVRVFTTKERVYMVITWKGLQEGSHHLKVSWLNPRGKIAEETLYDFVVLGRNIVYDTWVWMQVKPAEPGVEYDWEAVLGDWKVKASLDNEEISVKEFRLEAPPLNSKAPTETPR